MSKIWHAKRSRLHAAGNCFLLFLDTSRRLRRKKKYSLRPLLCKSAQRWMSRQKQRLQVRAGTASMLLATTTRVHASFAVLTLLFQPAESSIVLKEQIRKERIEERRRQLDMLRDVRQKQQAALHSLTMFRADEQCKSLSHYIRTKTQPAIFWLPKKPENVQDAIKRTADMLGGEMLLVKERLQKEREEDIAREMERQKEIEARITAAREMAEARERALLEEDPDAQVEKAEDGHDEAAALQQAVDDEAVEDDDDVNVLDEAL
jgi:hypothetical protein